jgi:hypothetical protein
MREIVWPNSENLVQAHLLKFVFVAQATGFVFFETNPAELGRCALARKANEFPGEAS